MVERMSEKHEVTGSSPVPGTSIRERFDVSASGRFLVCAVFRTRCELSTACQVLAPSELIALFRETAQGLVTIYAPLPQAKRLSSESHKK